MNLQENARGGRKRLLQSIIDSNVSEKSRKLSETRRLAAGDSPGEFWGFPPAVESMFRRRDDGGGGTAPADFIGFGLFMGFVNREKFLQCQYLHKTSSIRTCFMKRTALTWALLYHSAELRVVYSRFTSRFRKYFNKDKNLINAKCAENIDANIQPDPKLTRSTTTSVVLIFFTMSMQYASINTNVSQVFPSRVSRCDPTESLFLLR